MIVDRGTKRCKFCQSGMTYYETIDGVWSIKCAECGKHFEAKRSHDLEVKRAWEIRDLVGNG